MAIETYSVYTLLGIRFWDRVQNTQIRSGLVVRAWPKDAPRHITFARLSGAGIYAFTDLPGMASLERPLPGEDPFLASPRRFTICVHDHEDRFLPLLFTVDVPIKGVFPTDVLISPDMILGPSGAYLFSSPSRARQPGWACVRATVVDIGGEAAAYAVFELTVAGTKHFGIANKLGSIVVYFPYPDFREPASLASPGEDVTQSWDATLRVRYQPGGLNRLPGSKIPTIRSVFDQNEAQIWETASGPPVDEIRLQIEYRRETVVQTADLPNLQLTAAPDPDPPRIIT